MRRVLRIAALAGAMFAALAPALAVDAASVPEAKRTTLGLYLSASQAPAFLAARNGHSLFVDVRTPQEQAASGVPATVEVSAPVLLASADGQRRPNPDFVAAVARALAGKGLGKADPIVLICHSGRRSAMAANLLAAEGYANVYSIVDGFEGDGATARGWKGSGLPVRAPN